MFFTGIESRDFSCLLPFFVSKFFDRNCWDNSLWFRIFRVLPRCHWESKTKTEVLGMKDVKEEKVLEGKALQVLFKSSLVCFMQHWGLAAAFFLPFTWSIKFYCCIPGAGMSWISGIRRSTRIKTRPLEYWKGERFIFGRIHRSEWFLLMICIEAYYIYM